MILANLNLLPIFFILIFGILLFYKLFWKYLSLNNFLKILGFLPLVYFFEQLPTLNVGGFTLKLSFLLVGILIVLIPPLIIKKEIKKDFKLNKIWFVWLSFWLFSIPSFFYGASSDNFFPVVIQLIFVMFAASFLAQFMKNGFIILQKIVWISTFVCFFAAYQLLGDFAGLPRSLTFLRSQYTSANFGFARVHATALEPLFFAGMLFLPIFALTVGILTKNYIIDLNWILSLIKKISKNKISKILGFQIIEKFLNFWNNNILIFNGLFLYFHIFIFLLTFSKSAWLAIGISLLFLIPFLLKKLDWFNLARVGALGSFFGLTLGIPIAFIFPEFLEKFDPLIRNIFGTLQGETTSIIERQRFADAAIDLINQRPFFGYGPGSYSENALTVITRGVREDQIFVVNNMYLELWLEFGFIPLIVFASFLIALIFFGLLRSFKENLNSKKLVLTLSLTLSLIAYFVQWFTFSPIYIMPIFIQIGMLYASLSYINDKELSKELNLEVLAKKINSK